ncbi:MAG: ATP-binding protein [Patescibacteria group bacterium]|nr:ATP-binding protein [Patescibacteria group bacterium]
MKFDLVKNLKNKVKIPLPTKVFPSTPPSIPVANIDSTVQDLIAPSLIEVDFTNLKINNHYTRTLFIPNQKTSYPRYVWPNWLSALINYDHSLDISLYVFPVASNTVLDDLRRKIAEMEAEISMDMERGRIPNPATQAKLEDSLVMQEQLVKGMERYFQFGLYITVPADNLDELNKTTQGLKSTLEAQKISSKDAMLYEEEGFKTTLPLCLDFLNCTYNMDTTVLASTFPFASSELTANEGILYGINEHNGSLIIFDRFTMENQNACIFAKSGSGKSYMVKLEIMRSLMFDTEIIVIDPENEYENLSKAVGGEYITFGFNSKAKINPFDLSQVREEGENELNQKILSLHSLFKVIMGQLNPTEEAILDRALSLTYQMKGITQDPATQGKEPPLMEDLYKTLIGMEEPLARSLADRIEKFVKGSFSGIFDQASNVNIKNPFTVFSLRDLESALRPIAMFIILDFIWTKVRKELKKRLLVVDEAWFMMQSEDSANFLNSIAKRARKYYLGVTTITQDVEDFLKNDIGKTIVTNSSIQVLMKQHPAAIEKVAQTFYLSEGEKQFLLACDVGEGLFFAGSNHVAIKVVASPEEHELVTSKPQEILAKQNKAKEIPLPEPVKETPPPTKVATQVINQTTSVPIKIETIKVDTQPVSQTPLPPRFKSEIIMENNEKPTIQK